MMNLEDKAKSYPQEFQQLVQKIETNLKKLPFITKTEKTTDFYHDPMIIAEGKREPKVIRTEMSISLSPEHIEFLTISIHPNDQNKGQGVEMVKTVNDAVINSKYKDIKVYVSSPRNQEFWDKMETKFPKLNWRMKMKASNEKIIDDVLKESASRSLSQKGDISQALADQGFFDGKDAPKALKERQKLPGGNPVDVKKDFSKQNPK